MNVLVAALRPHFRTGVLLLVGVLGVFATAWVWLEIAVGANAQIEQRFERSARDRTDRIVQAFRAPLDQFIVLQRLFHSVGKIEKPVFDQFVRPMLRQPGVLGYFWAPVQVSPEREQRFPLAYTLTRNGESESLQGLDVGTNAAQRALLQYAVEDGWPTASGIVQSPLHPVDGARTILVIAPVFEGGVIPASRSERPSHVRGVLILVLDVDRLFSEASLDVTGGSLTTRLIDYVAPSHDVLRWGGDEAAPVSGFLGRSLWASENFGLAGRIWTIRVEPTRQWMVENSARGVLLVPFVGFLLTAILLVYLRRLLGRSELAETLAESHERNIAQRIEAEMWARKLLLAVEQNPATIYIVDPEGRIEWVNDRFVESTGYTREEALGQNARMLRPPKVDESLYRSLWATIEAGKTWRGELQNCRRDGSLCWERATISPIRSGDQSITNYIVILEDVTRLRETVQLLQDSEARFRSAMEVMAEGLAILSADGRFVFSNRTYDRCVGCEDEGAQGLCPNDLPVEWLDEDGVGCAADAHPVETVLKTGQSIRDRIMGLRLGNAEIRWVLVNASPMPVGTDGRLGVVQTLTDVTARRQAEEQSRLAFEAVRQSGEGILITDARHRILSVNPAFERVTGYPADEVLGKEPSFVASARHDLQFHAAMREMLGCTGYWQGEVWNQRSNGDVYPEWLGVSVVRADDGQPRYYIYIYSDMSERQAAQKHIEFLAHHDPLTGLPNRLLLRDRVVQSLAHAVRQHSRVALLFLDLDRFKTVNDSLGHPVGDALLKKVVERLKSCVRESDTICRQGGDEFILLLNDVRDRDAISRVADKIHQVMGEPFILDGHKLGTTFSIGIALFPDDADDFDSLLQKADTAMYHAKEAGRNAHRFFTEQMNLKVVEHMTLQSRLRRALENHEFVLYYQPQLDLQENRIAGVEALIRWDCPEEGLVSPARFIPVAEETGLIVHIGAWVVAEACRQARAWQDAGLEPFSVAVNLSAVQFRRLDLVNTVINALVLSDLDAQWLELELTESILIQDAESTLDCVRRLKALGVRLSVDDFGTGYSSLAYLKRFAVDKLKIDQSFVADLVRDPEDAAIVRAIIQMARSLKLRTVAEGVERKEIADLLRLFLCDEIQGYWFARPMRADELEVFVRDFQAANPPRRLSMS